MKEKNDGKKQFVGIFRDLFSEKKVEDYEFKCLTALFPYRPKPSPTSSRIAINL
jgi:hypothetical protein